MKSTEEIRSWIKRINDCPEPRDCDDVEKIVLNLCDQVDELELQLVRHTVQLNCPVDHRLSFRTCQYCGFKASENK